MFVFSVVVFSQEALAATFGPVVKGARRGLLRTRAATNATNGSDGSAEAKAEALKRLGVLLVPARGPWNSRLLPARRGFASGFERRVILRIDGTQPLGCVEAQVQGVGGRGRCFEEALKLGPGRKPEAARHSSGYW